MRASRSAEDSRWMPADASRASWSLAGRLVRWWAKLGPMSPRASFCWASADRFSTKARRRMTHSGFRPSSLATPETVRPSSSSKDLTTQPSSRGVRVRRGALASSSRRLCSARAPGDSMMTGIRSRPSSTQEENRLKPSMISKKPSSVATTRRGRAFSSHSGP